MGVGGLLPLQEVGPSIFRWESRRRLPNRDGHDKTESLNCYSRTDADGDTRPTWTYQGPVLAAKPSENRLFHFGKSSHRRLTDNLFKSLNTEHVSGPIEHLDEPIGVENHSIAGKFGENFPSLIKRL